MERPKTWPEVDGLIGLAARTDSQMDLAKAQADEETRRVSAALEKRLAPLKTLKEGIEEAVETFASAHRKDFQGERSMTLAHGRIGWRLPPPSVRFVRPVEEILEGLKERGLEAAILTTERPSKDILATFEESLLADLGVRVTQRDNFFVEFAEAGVSEAPNG